MLRLRTLGGIYVVNEQGEPLTGAATQRRLLALLAALAVAGDRGFSRDKLFALLWPDVDEERARHSLTQALYSARRALGVDDLFLPGTDLRLNRARVESDVQKMEEALEAGELEQALALYHGPFADGFFLTGSAEFEQWISLQRARLEDLAAGALERLAEGAEAAGATREALGWRKRLAAIRPLDTAATVALMTTLAQAGDRAGAIQHARLHETLLREQFGLEPDPQVTELAARLREPSSWQTAPLAPAPAAGPADFSTLTETSVRTTTLPVRALATRAGRWWATRSRGWWVVPLAMTAIVLGALLGRRQPAVPLAAPAPLLEQKVVVAPFRVTGASASLGYLREGLVELLSTRLADDSAARSVDAGAVLAAWRAAGLTDTADAPRDTVVRLADELGAERVVIGSVVGTTSRVVLTAAVVEVGSGAATGEAIVEGPADSITALVDRLAARLLVLGAGDEASLSSQTTGSLRALRAFLEGQAAFRRSSYTVALRWYGEALRLDSTFALAALQLAHTADRLHLAEPRTRPLALAWRERHVLDARARALLVALVGPRYPAPSESEEYLAVWERLIDLTPDRADAWFEAGARLALEGKSAGEPDARKRALVMLERALRIEPTHWPTQELLAFLAYPLAPGTKAQSLSDALPADSAVFLDPFLRWRKAVATGDSVALFQLRDSLPRLGPRNLRAIAVTAQLEAVGLGDARRAVERLRVQATRPADRLDAALAEHALALNEGRVRDALAATDQLADLQPGARAHLRLRVLDALYGDGDSRAAEIAARALRRSVAARPAAEPAARAVQLADACVLAQWRLWGSDTTGVPQTIVSLRAEPLRVSAAAPPISATPLVCAELLEAALAVVLDRPTAPAAVARLDSLAFTAGSSGDAMAYAPLFIARLHDRLGDPRAALEAVRRRGELIGWPRYLAAALRDEGRYATDLGAAEEAAPAYRRYLALRARPDGELRAGIEEIRQAMPAGNVGQGR